MPTTPPLFPVTPSPKPLSPLASTLPQDPLRGLRLLSPQRHQIVMPHTLDQLIASDHPVRAIWAVIQALDLSALYAKLDCRASNPGRPAIHPQIPLALWIWAVSQGEGSARSIATSCQFDTVYRWIAGGVSVSYHHLSDFRSDSGELFSQLITQIVTACLAQELLSLHRVAGDGTRVRASAGADSFRRKATLEQLEQEAKEHLAAVLAEANDPSKSRVAKAAQQRGAEDFLARVQRAQEQVPAVQAAND